MEPRQGRRAEDRGLCWQGAGGGGGVRTVGREQGEVKDRGGRREGRV